MRYVVTGAAGFIGSQLLRKLLESGHDAVGWELHGLLRPGVEEENAAGLPVERIDLAEDELELAGVDGVFHLAGQPGVRSFGGVFPVYIRQNVLASQRLFEAAAAAAPGRSSRRPRRSTATRRPIRRPRRRPRGRSRPTAHEARLRAPRVLLRARVRPRRGRAPVFNAFGPRQRPDMAFARMVACLAAGRPFELYGDGTQSRSFTYVDDVVAATVLAMEKASAGAVYNVGGGAEISMLDAIDALGRVAGRALEVNRSPRLEGDVARTAADTARIRSEIGWEPTTSFAEGLEAQWRWAADRVAAA